MPECLYLLVIESPLRSSLTHVTHGPRNGSHNSNPNEPGPPARWLRLITPRPQVQDLPPLLPEGPAAAGSSSSPGADGHDPAALAAQVPNPARAVPARDYRASRRADRVPGRVRLPDELPGPLQAVGRHQPARLPARLQGLGLTAHTLHADGRLRGLGSGTVG